MFPLPRVAAVALLLVGAVALSTVPATGLSPATTVSQTDSTFGESPAVDYTAEMETDGDARWNITTTVQITTEADREAYRSTAADFENGELTPFGYEAFETGLNGVDGQTDRDMRLTDVTRTTSTEAELENGVGRYTIEFTWENFMRSTENGLLIDRAVLVTEDGALWFPGLGESETLTIVAPPEYGIRDSSTGAQDGRLRWTGPAVFDDSSLVTRFVGTNGENPPNGSDEPDEPDEPTDSSGIFPWVLLPIAAIGIVIAVLLTRSDQVELDLPTDFDVSKALPLGAAGTTTTDSTEEPVPESDVDDDSPDQSDDGIDTELLSDEERVERLLSSNGGRMKQADIVKETDWSNAKVSQLLSSMEEDGQIDKLRIGRENLISFSDEDITDSDE